MLFRTSRDCASFHTVLTNSSLDVLDITAKCRHNQLTKVSRLYNNMCYKEYLVTLIACICLLIIDIFRRVSHLSSDLFYPLCSEHSFIYLLAKLTARIVMGPDYPASAPIFCVNIVWGTNRDSKNDTHLLVNICSSNQAHSSDFVILSWVW